MDEYVLWSATLGGWFSKTAQYTTQFEQAQTYPKSEALDIARRHLTNDQFGVIVVRRADMEEVRG